VKVKPIDEMRRHAQIADDLAGDLVPGSNEPLEVARAQVHATLAVAWAQVYAGNQAYRG
jgi:hypothetical protein